MPNKMVVTEANCDEHGNNDNIPYIHLCNRNQDIYRKP